MEAFCFQHTQLIDFVIEGDGNRNSEVGVVTRLGDKQRGIFVWFVAGVQLISVPKRPTWSWGQLRCLFHCVPEIIFAGVKRPDPEGDYLNLGSGLRMNGAITPLPMHLHGVQNYNFIFFTERKRSL